MAVTHHAHSLLLQSRELGDPCSEWNSAEPCSSWKEALCGNRAPGRGALLIQNRECHLPSGGGGALLRPAQEQ